MKKIPPFGRARVRVRRVLRNRFFRSLVVICVLAGMVGGGLWAKQKLEGRQSRKLAAMAKKSLQEGKAEEARMGLESALQLNPRNAQALRMMARLREAQGAGPEALDAMRRLSESGQMSLEDLRAYAVLAVRQGDLALAERLANASALGQNAMLRHMVRAEVAAAKNNPEEVEKELRAAVEEDKTGTAKFTLAQFLVTRRLNAETAPEVLGMLREISKRQDAMGAEALALALRSGVVPASEAESWVATMRAHPAAGARILLLADTAEIQMKPQTKGDVARRVRERLKGKPAEVRMEAMVWAIQIGEPAVASSLLQPDEAVRNAGVFSAWLDALSQQGRWAEISTQLERQDQPLPGYLKGLYAGRALAEQGKTKEGREVYAKVLEQAHAKREDFIQAVAYLGTAGEDWAFEQGLRQALKERPEEREKVMRAVIPAVAQRRDAARTLQVYQIAASTPGAAEDLTMRNDMDYLAILLGRPVDTKEIAARRQANPRDFPLRVTNAMALLRDGKGKEALQVLEDCEPDVHVMSLAPHQRMVVAAAMAASGKQKEADQVASTIPPISLSVQEAAFLVEHLRKAAPETPPSKKQEPASSKSKKK